MKMEMKNINLKIAQQQQIIYDLCSICLQTKLYFMFVCLVGCCHSPTENCDKNCVAGK